MKTPPPEDPKQARRQKASPGSEMRKAVAVGCALAAGCTGVQLKPDPFTCPEGAVATRKELHWSSGEHFHIVLDDRYDPEGDVWLRAGDTVVGVVPEGGGPRERKIVPPGTRFLGGKVYVWPEKTASGRPGRVVVKYERVKLPQQDEVPVCFVVDTSADELKDGAAKTSNGDTGFVEDEWRPADF